MTAFRVEKIGTTYGVFRGRDLVSARILRKDADAEKRRLARLAKVRERGARTNQTR
jgi:hypothetical protein